jgi:glycosyltransferase involved in cell wall biosynthesis
MGPIVIVHSSDEWYGADRMVAELARVAARDRAVQVWLPQGSSGSGHTLSSELRRHGISSRQLPLPVLRRRDLTPAGLARIARDVRRVRRELRLADPAVVVAATSAVIPVLWAVPRRSAAVLYAQEIWHGAEGGILGSAARRCDQVLAISEPVRRSLPGRLAARTTIVPNGVPDPVAPPVPIPAHGPLTYVVASRWNSWKGHAFLLQAWGRAGCPGRLIVLGGPPPAGIAVDVPALVAALPDPDSVEVVGEVDDITTWIDRADVLVLPSTNPEPFGLVVIEAFARARPVIATDHGAPSTVVTPEAGWLVDPASVDAFAALLAGLQRQDVRSRGQGARRRYEEHYSIDAWRAGVADFLAGLPGRRTTAP